MASSPEGIGGKTALISHVNMDHACGWETQPLTRLMRFDIDARWGGHYTWVRELFPQEAEIVHAFSRVLYANKSTRLARYTGTLSGADAISWCQRNMRRPEHAELLMDNALFHPADSCFCIRHRAKD